MSDQKPHRIQQREARRISGEEGISYQAALTRVRAAAPQKEGVPGLLDHLLSNSSIDDIILRRYDELYTYDTGQETRVALSPFRSDEHVLGFLKGIFASQGQELGGASPFGEMTISG